MIEENQIEAGFEPQQRMLIADLETLRTVADPLRVKILELTSYEARTVKQLAAMLKIVPTKLYYHVNTLEQAGLLRVVGTRLVSGIVEKQYRVVAHSIGVDPAVLSPALISTEEILDLAISGVIDVARLDMDNLRAEIAGSEKDQADELRERGVAIMRTIGCLTREEAAEFTQRLQALVGEFRARDSPAPETLRYSLTILMYPAQITSPGSEEASDAG